MIEYYTQQLRDISTELHYANIVTAQEETFQSIVTIMVQLIDEGKTDELREALQRHFPSYYREHPTMIPASKN